ncbi:MAG: hypothetical protein M3P51_06340 [Chloroflexota bacterium]|nr:hypothetical protein [Chloroflexota bacterium]
MEAYIRAIHALATDAQFRAEFGIHPTAALERRGLALHGEAVLALSSVVDGTEDDSGSLPPEADPILGWWRRGVRADDRDKLLLVAAGAR